MWNRAGLKRNAKEHLKNNYWNALLVCIVAGLFSGGTGGVSSTGKVQSGMEEFRNYKIDNEVLIAILLMVAGIILIAGIIGTVIRICIGNVLTVGKNRYFMVNRQRKTGVGEITYAFKGRNYGNVVLTLFLKDLYIFLWSLLFVVPGIIKAYEYYMVPYLLSENPGMDRKRAFEISRQMMDGEKWNTFVLEISFWGWLLLGTLCCGIGVIFVLPYYEATFAELYSFLREKYLGIGVVNAYEMPGYAEQEILYENKF